MSGVFPEMIQAARLQHLSSLHPHFKDHLSPERAAAAAAARRPGISEYVYISKQIYEIQADTRNMKEEGTVGGDVRQGEHL